MEDKVEIAFRIHIEPLSVENNATKVKTVLKVLHDISESYYNFLEIQYQKSEKFGENYNYNKAIDLITDELSLFIVDLKQGCYEAVLAPGKHGGNKMPGYEDEKLAWERETFLDFKEKIVRGEWEDPGYMASIDTHYTPEERKRIFAPLFASVGNGHKYRINLKDKNRLIKTLVKPGRTMEFYT